MAVETCDICGGRPLCSLAIHGQQKTLKLRNIDYGPTSTPP